MVDVNVFESVHTGYLRDAQILREARQRIRESAKTSDHVSQKHKRRARADETPIKDPEPKTEPDEEKKEETVDIPAQVTVAQTSNPNEEKELVAED